jgi:hypothetical protein
LLDCPADGPVLNSRDVLPGVESEILIELLKSWIQHWTRT